MRYVWSLACASALVFASAALAEGEGSSKEETGSKIEQLLSKQLLERLKSYVNRGLVESEQLSQYVDREYWDTIKDDFTAKISTIISEDEFIQAIVPILESVRAELQDLIKLTVQELTVRGERLTARVRAALEQLRQRATEIVVAGIAKIKELAETKPEEYRAFIAKAGEAVGNTASSIAEETTLLAGVRLSAVAGDRRFSQL